MRIRGSDVLIPPIGLVQTWSAQYRGAREVIDASQGTSGAKPPLVPLGASGAFEAYGARWGRVGLRDAMARDVTEIYGASDLGASEVLITAGCNAAFCGAARALVDPGESVLLLSPFYFNHDMWLRLNGIEPVYLELPIDGDLDTIALASVSKKVSAVVAVSPSNPTGAELSKQSIARIVAFCRERGIPFLLDETYANFRRDASSRPHEIFDLPDWRDFFVSLRSLSKEFSMPGHRVGAIVADPLVLDAVSKWHDCMSIVAPAAGQEFAEFALTHLLDWRAQLASEIRGKGERFVARVHDEQIGFRVDSWGAFFAWLEHPFLGLSDEEAAQRLAATAGVLTVPGSYFAPRETGRLRLSFGALESPALEDIIERLSGVSQ